MTEIQWSPTIILNLEQLANGTRAGRHPMEAKLSPALLLAAAGNLSQAEAHVLNVAGDEGNWKDMHPQAFVSLVIALFVVQRLDIVSRMLMSKYDFRSPVKLTFVDGQFYPITVRWEIEPDAGSHFLFNSNLLQNDRTQNQVLAFLWTIPLFVQYANSELLERGSVMVNLGDIGFVPGLAFCDNRPDYFLVPDNLFISSRGYERTRLALREKEIPWNQRHATALWRGTTTGHPSDRSVGWRSLPRVGLCAISQRHQEFIDAGITRATQVASQSPPEVEAEIRASGIWKSFVPVDEFSQYKYQIDIDGNTNSWPGLFQKLLTGSAVLKVTSPSGHRQWYYDRLRPWYNYVPISSNLSDLVDKIRWLKLHDEVAQRIGSAGRELAETATLETELKQAVHTITAALRSSAYAAAGSLTTDSDLKPENVGAG